MSTLSNLAIAGLFAGAVTAGGTYLWNKSSSPEVKTTPTTITTETSSEADICTKINNAANPEKTKRYHIKSANNLMKNGAVLKSPMLEAKGQALKAKILAC